MTVRSVITADTDLIARGQLDLTAAVGATGLSVGDGVTANAIAGLFGTDLAFVRSGGVSATTTTLIRYSAEILDIQASLTANARAELSFNETFFETLSFRQKSDSGVNIDEELAGLVALETAFAASARVLSVVSDMLEDLINTVR